eukprot:jgi/Botrbrau1/10112/Bobra.20_2s0019.1
MDESLYDEFGNYIGPDLGSDKDDDSEEEQEDEDEEMEDAERAADARMAMTMNGGQDIGEEYDDDEDPANAVVLHEDKKYYPTAEEVYGGETETLVMEEDAQPLEVPIVAPIKQKKFEVLERKPLKAHANPEFMAGLTSNPDLVRNIAVVGHLHHGKTIIMDMFVEQTHEIRHQWKNNEKPMRFTDTRLDEQARGVSLKMVPMSLVMQGSSGKSYLLNLIDTPGHINFNDEVSAAMRLADGALLVVDAAEGIMLVTEKAIQQALQNGLPICLVFSKVDRLITELKLPPGDAYHKLRHTVEEVNALISTYSGGDESLLVDPVRGNVGFSSAQSGWSFTLESFAQLYCDVHGIAMDPREFAKRLWGEVFYQPESRTFKKKPPPGGGERSFVEFVLEPLYKIYSQGLGESDTTLKDVLKELGVWIKPSSFYHDIKPLLKEVCSEIFGSATGLVDMMARHCPTARQGNATKVARIYTGPQDSDLATHMKLCNAKGPTVIHVAKLFPKPDCSAFDAFGRVMSGSIRPGQRVKVLGEGYTPEDEEDSSTATVTNVWIFQARYRIPLTRGVAGTWVLLEGLDATITKTATIVEDLYDNEDDPVHIFKPLTFATQAVVKIACEPLNPSELPKMVEGLRRINKSYPLAVTKVEESGEHAVLGTGELYCDSIMKDLRELYSDIEVKVADPVVAFCETVVETSSLKCFAETPNKKNKLTMIAEPLEKGLSEDIEEGRVDITWNRKKLGDFFQTKYDWDLLAARSIWAFGPDRDGPNILLDDTLPSEVDKNLLNAVRDSIVQGFQWGTTGRASLRRAY